MDSVQQQVGGSRRICCALHALAAHGRYPVRSRLGQAHTRALMVRAHMLLGCVLQVNRAVDYVGGGTKALVEAKQYQKSKRKWCCCAIITLLIILIIVFVVVSGGSAGRWAAIGCVLSSRWRAQPYGDVAASGTAAAESSASTAVSAALHPSGNPHWVFVDCGQCSERDCCWWLACRTYNTLRCLHAALRPGLVVSCRWWWCMSSPGSMPTTTTTTSSRQHQHQQLFQNRSHSRAEGCCSCCRSCRTDAVAAAQAGQGSC